MSSVRHAMNPLRPPKASSSSLVVAAVVGSLLGAPVRVASAAGQPSATVAAAAGVPSKPSSNAQPPRPEAIARAESLAAEAYVAYGRKDYEAAARLYEKALSAASSADILYNLARVYDLGLRDRARAEEYYQRYLEHPSSARPRTEYAQLRITELREAARAEELVAVREKEGGEAKASTLSSAGLPDQGIGAGTGSPGQELGEPWSTRDKAGVIAAGAGFLGVAVGLGFGISAYSKSNTWQRECDGNVCASQRGVDAARDAADRGHVATISLAAGGGLLAIGAALLFLGNEEKVEKDPRGMRLDVGAPGADLFGARVSTAF